MSKFVFYRRLDGDGVPMYFVKSQLQYDKVLKEAHPDRYEREVLAESDDRELLEKMWWLAQGGEE